MHHCTTIVPHKRKRRNFSMQWRHHNVAFVAHEKGGRRIRRVNILPSSSQGFLIFKRVNISTFTLSRGRFVEKRKTKTPRMQGGGLKERNDMRRYEPARNKTMVA